MANVKITDLTAYTDPVNTDVLPIVDVTSDVTKKVSIANVMKNASFGSAAAPGISFDGDPNTGIYRPGADQLAISTNGTGRLFVDANGRVGLGTTSPVALLNISSGDTAFLPAAEADELFLESSGDCGLTIGCGANQKNNIYFGESGTGISRGAIVYDTNTDSLAFSTAGLSNERARIDSSGRLGIGTASPGDLLHVMESSASAAAALTASVAQFERNGACAITISSTNTTTGSIFFGDDASAGIGRVQFDHSDNSLQFWSTLERARIDSSGTFRVKGAGTAGVTDAVQLSGSAPANSLLLDASGRVGIGTSTVTPVKGGTALEILNATGSEVIIGSSDTTATAGDFIGAVVFRNSDLGGTPNHYAGMWAKATNDSGSVDLRFASGRDLYEADTPQMTLNATGLGIGTTSPSAKLEVIGDAKIGETSYPLRFATGSSTGVIEFPDTSARSVVRTLGATPLEFEINSSPVARFDTSGRLLVGTTSALANDDLVSVDGQLLAGGQRMARLAKTVTVGNTVTFDIVGSSRVLAKVRIIVGYSGNNLYQMHAQYDYVSCNSSTSGGTATQTEILQVEAGNAQFNYADITVSRPANSTVRITYSPTSGAGTHTPTIYVDGVFTSLT